MAQIRVKSRIFFEPVCFVTRILVKCKRDLRESVCEDWRCIELAQNRVRWQVFELDSLKLWISEHRLSRLVS